MRQLLFFLCVCCALAGAAVAEEVPAPSAAERPADALDCVVRSSGEIVRGVIVAGDSSAITLRLRSGETRIIPRAEVRIVNSWSSSSAPIPPAATAGSDLPTVAKAARGRWYGWQTLSSDAVTLALIPISAEVAVGTNGSAPAKVLVGLSATTFLLGAPIIHKLHQDSWVPSLESLGLRVGLTLVGGGAGFAIANASSGACSGTGFICDLDPLVEGAVVGIALGMVAASALDAALLAREPLPSSGAQAVLAPLVLPRGTALAPQGGTGLCFAARF